MSKFVISRMTNRSVKKMIRTVITPERQDLSIHIPESYIGKPIEVILFPVDEPTKEVTIIKKKTSDFRGTLKLTDEQYEDFQTHLKNIRNEWDRDI